MSRQRRGVYQEQYDVPGAPPPEGPVIDPQYQQFLQQSSTPLAHRLTGSTPQWPPMDLQRRWQQELQKLSALGFDFEDKIGQGLFGEVWRVQDRNVMDNRGLPRRLASKIMSIANYADKGLSLGDALVYMLRDVTSLRGLAHPNITAIETVVHVMDQKTGFRSLFVFVFMELCDGNLTHLLRLSPHYRMIDTRTHKWFTQILKGLAYLHQNNVAHLDIKPSNILYVERPSHYRTDGILSKTERVYKLCDFGLALKFRADQPMTSSQAADTGVYRAPELAQTLASHVWGALGRAQQFDTTKCDVFALGVTLGVCLTGVRPNTPETAREWLDGTLATEPKSRSNKRVLDLLHRMCDQIPANRPSMAHILQHEWVVNEP